MTEQGHSRQGIKFLVAIAALVLNLGGINQAKMAMESSLAAVFLAMLGAPPVLWFERKRVPSVVAVLLVVAGMVVILLILGSLAVASFSNFYSELQAFFASKGILGMDEVLLQAVNPGRAFILFEASSFPVKLRAVLGDPHRTFPQFTRFYVDIERYVIIKTLVSLATGMLIGIWLFILGVDFPVLWGFLAFLLNHVPSVGSTIAAVPAVLFALVQLGTGPALLATAGS